MLGAFLPAKLPAFSVLLHDFMSPSAVQLARAFKVSRNTAHRWIREDRAPAAVVMALYLAAPRYGGREACARVLHAEEAQRLSAALVDSLHRDNAALRRELARVVAAGDFGCANDVTLQPLPRRSA